MSKDRWRYDPNKDYRQDEDDFRGGRGGGFRPIKKHNKFKKDKYDGKRRYKQNRDSGW